MLRRNGKYHNRALGMNMVVERSTADDVRSKFQNMKKKQTDFDPDLSVADGKGPADAQAATGPGYVRVQSVRDAACWWRVVVRR